MTLKLRTRRTRAGLAKFQLMRCALNTTLGIKYGACRARISVRSVGKILRRDSFIVGRFWRRALTCRRHVNAETHRHTTNGTYIAWLLYDFEIDGTSLVLPPLQKSHGNRVAWDIVVRRARVNGISRTASKLGSNSPMLSIQPWWVFLYSWRDPLTSYVHICIVTDENTDLRRRSSRIEC